MFYLSVSLLQEFVGADGSDDNAIIENPEAAEQVTTVLQLENSQDLCFALTTLRTETRGMLHAYNKTSSEGQVPNLHPSQMDGQTDDRQTDK